MDDIEDPKVVVCSGCNEFIGILVWLNDRYWLQVGNNQFSYTHGRCKMCKRLWTFNSQDFQLRRIIERVVKK